LAGVRGIPVDCGAPARAVSPGTRRAGVRQLRRSDEFSDTERRESGKGKLMDELTKRKNQLVIAEAAANDAKRRHDELKNRVTSLRSQLNQLHSTYESQKNSVTSQLAQAERECGTAWQELKSAEDMRDAIKSIIPPYS